ncbi:hypothetical protein Q5M85_03475 [Paraclostridium bifermentans]|nr:hypothetical protein [Paraclostridium bifermentans]
MIKIYILANKITLKIYGAPIAYWISESVIKSFNIEENLSDVAAPRQGLSTSDNDRFLRVWSEVSIDKIGFNCIGLEDANNSGLKWFPYNKGGTFRKWYGNNIYLINWENDGKELKEWAHWLNTHRTPMGRLVNKEYYFKEGITWSSIASSKPSFRYCKNGFIFDSKGPMCFSKSSKCNINYISALLNSSITVEFLKILAPTLDFNQGPIGKIPLIIERKDTDEIDNIVGKNINISKKDWDSFETSWDFKKHPIIEFKSNNIENSFNNWAEFKEKQFNQLKANEEELNRIFIDIYGLQDELTPEVEDKDITIRKADRERDIKSFISYAVGCMLGRYSLDEEGLVFAGGEFDINKYKSFKADTDGIIPITDAEYFEDDIVSKFVEFVKVAFGEESLEENLNYIADTQVFKRKANGNKS